MADKVVAPQGGAFLLRWTTDAYVEMVNRFQIYQLDDTAPDKFEEHKGKPPRQADKGKPQMPTKGKVTAVLTITKDGAKNGYRDNVPKPQSEERWDPAKQKFFHEYTFFFKARFVGEYVFTVEYTAEANQGMKLETPPPIVKEVQVVAAEKPNQRRQDLLDLIDKWFPSSVMAAPKVPPGETQDILAKGGWSTVSDNTWVIPERHPAGPIETLPKEGQAAWTQSGASVAAKGLGQISAAKKSYNKYALPGRQAAYDALPAGEKAGHARPIEIPIDTSCISVMQELMKMWGKQFLPDVGTMTKPDPAFYVVATDEYAKASPTQPKPGDILYLGKESSRGYFQHVCILVSISSELWVTADGGGGGVPEQTATVNNKPISKSSAPVVPMFASVTDNKNKALNGWVDLDRVPNDKYNPDGSRK